MKYTLIRENTVLLYRIQHPDTLTGKLLLKANLIRRWEKHHLLLMDSCIISSKFSFMYQDDYNMKGSLSIVIKAHICPEFTLLDWNKEL
ncbi:hypothetical protein TrispH2_000186 [Trichoplax sp. H2]|nr:hypothetical protein TrispH2_000186 [Trichoplax sp. H2]|eukprot:RDD47274.1 hypothetical protein TrispH2_000186 [Trichoplax sp. H2]